MTRFPLPYLLKDAQYYERKSKELSDELNEMTLQRDQLENALQQVQGNGEEFQKRAKHLEQALEKVMETRRDD